MVTRHDKGMEGEELAARYLKERGIEVITRNFRCPIGEIDMVGRHGKTVVFIEVRSRTDSRFGLPQESITRSKQKRLTRLAQWYLKRFGLEREPARFDVVAILWRDGEPEVKWIPNAFEAYQ